jgi:hypothetical protein
MDHIKNALTKTENPPKKFKIAPSFFAPKNTKPPPPKKIQKWPHGFSPKKIQNYPQIIQKRPQIRQRRPQTLQKDLKMKIKAKL